MGEILNGVEALDRLKERLEQISNEQARVYVTHFELKVKIAEFHLNELPKKIHDEIPERAHAEACIFQSKAALDCVAEAVNQIYQLQIDPDCAFSIAYLGGGGGERLEEINPNLREYVIKVLKEPWWKYFQKGLRHKLTHRGPALHSFYLHGPAHFLEKGQPRKMAVIEDLRYFISKICDSVDRIFDLLLKDGSWQAP